MRGVINRLLRKNNPQAPLGDLYRILDLINEAFDGYDELAGCVQNIEATREGIKAKRMECVEFVTSLFNKREAEAASNFRVVSGLDPHNLAFTILDGNYYVWDRFGKATWCGSVSGKKLRRILQPPQENGWVVFEKAPPELVRMWNDKRSHLL